jgi:predicted Zn-dependent protease with MMP-like domain
LYDLAVFAVTDERFEQFISDALASLPEELAGAIDNVAIMVEDEAKGRSLFGLFQGVPLTKRAFYSGAQPDRITLFQKTICQHCNNENEVRAQVRKTIIHEIAHHFGISDPRLEELGWA